jgi:hypothetical protein
MLFLLNMLQNFGGAELRLLVSTPKTSCFFGCFVPAGFPLRGAIAQTGDRQAHPVG